MDIVPSLILVQSLSGGASNVCAHPLTDRIKYHR